MDAANAERVARRFSMQGRRALVTGGSVSIGRGRRQDAARAAKVPIIGLGHGYSDVPIAQLEPDVTLDSFAGLVDAIESFRNPA